MDVIGGGDLYYSEVIVSSGLTVFCTSESNNRFGERTVIGCSRLNHLYLNGKDKICKSRVKSFCIHGNTSVFFATKKSNVS